MKNLHKPKILIVDDISLNLKVQALLFTEREYAVLIANSALQALVIAEEKQPDIIIADIMMPEIDGIELCRRLKLNALTKHIPVLFLSADTSKTTIENAFEAGGCDYLSKPFHENELFLRVKNHLPGNNAIFTGRVGKRSVAVVDDNHLNRLIMNDFLEYGGFNSFTFESASDLFEVKDLNKFDMILLDIEMPILNGWKTIEILKIKKFSNRVIAISAHDDHIFKEKCLKHGFHDIIYKPIYKNIMLNTIIKHLTPINEISENEPYVKSEILDLAFFFEVTKSDIPYRIDEYRAFTNLVDEIIILTKKSILEKKTSQKLMHHIHKYLNVGHFFCDKTVVNVVKSIEKRLRIDAGLVNEGSNFLNLMGQIKNELKNNFHKVG
jgi:CheY-like chemotaxis protein